MRFFGRQFGKDKNFLSPHERRVTIFWAPLGDVRVLNGFCVTEILSTA